MGERGGGMRSNASQDLTPAIGLPSPKGEEKKFNYQRKLHAKIFYICFQYFVLILF
jgi:hypothetical protein